MLSDFLKKNITSQAASSAGGFVEYGFGQVEPNHLSAQRTGQIYAQLPAEASIDVLENGQFVKYDYAKGVCDFKGVGEWMLVFNEIKLYREHQMDCEFAMTRGNYFARIYSPVNGDTNFEAQSRFYGANEDEPSWKSQVQTAGVPNGGTEVMNLEKERVTAPADMYELHYNEEPFHIESQTAPAKMPAGTVMVPRVFKTNVGDIMTTNMVKETVLKVGDLLTPQADNGILAKNGAGTSTPADKVMAWQVVKIYTLPDHQKAVKVMRVQ